MDKQIGQESLHRNDWTRKKKYQCTISKSETVFHLFDMVHLLSYEMTPYNTTISLCLY